MIHKTAIISKDSQIHENVSIGPYSVIGPNVEIMQDSIIEANVVIKGPTTIGCDNHIFQFSSIGDSPQDKKYLGEPTKLIIGERNTIREGCTINRGTIQDNGVTIIGDDNWIMAYAHIAHDCIVGNNTIFANNASIAGHVKVEDWAILGGFTTAHQFCRIGPYSFSSMFTYITKDVPAYVVVSGRPAEPRGVNLEGLKRKKFDNNSIQNIKEAYKIIYRQGLKLEEAISRLQEISKNNKEILPILESLNNGSRSIVR